ncbi:outer membrane beta-barrel protein [Vibrio vulnificus]|nr:outer membrane beta-barrel protein [Vibrio vulnificus]ELR8772620.1 outer membrane beta-barrel protein [Vibrio vulnificus]ELV8635761.1 outer membrane beta-barrel protein [Vibrio vulnificus]
MNKINLLFISSVLALSASYTQATYANECEGLECTYINGSVGSLISKDDQTSDLFTRYGIGYHINQYVDIGVSGMWSGYTDAHSVDLYLRGNLPISNEATLYVDGGATSVGDHITAGAGVLYSITPQISVDVGYRYYSAMSGELNPGDKGDAYTFGIGLQYDFFEEEETPLTVVQQRPVEPEPVIEEPLPEVITGSCSNSWPDSMPIVVKPSTLTTVHIVEEGEWLLKIASNHCTSLDVLFDLNPWLRSRWQKFRIYPGEELVIPIK